MFRILKNSENIKSDLSSASVQFALREKLSEVPFVGWRASQAEVQSGSDVRGYHPTKVKSLY